MVLVGRERFDLKENQRDTCNFGFAGQPLQERYICRSVFAVPHVGL